MSPDVSQRRHAHPIVLFTMLAACGGLLACSNAASVDGETVGTGPQADAPGPSPDPSFVARAYSAGSAWTPEMTSSADAYVLPQLSAVSGVPSARLEAFVASGRAEDLLMAAYCRLGLVRGTPNSENALLFVTAWEVYHDQEASRPQVRGVLSQIGSRHASQADPEHEVQKRFYELLGATVLFMRDESRNDRDVSFREQLRTLIRTGSGNDLAEFDLTPEGFQRR